MLNFIWGADGVLIFFVLFSVLLRYQVIMMCRLDVPQLYLSDPPHAEKAPSHLNLPPPVLP